MAEGNMRVISTDSWLDSLAILVNFILFFIYFFIFFFYYFFFFFGGGAFTDMDLL